MVQKLFSPLRNMTRGGIAGLLTVLTVAGVVLFFAAARWVNTSPSQCVTCHPQMTALWQRSQGHPAARVSCYQCHADHAAPPDSLNLGAVVRDQLVPEKYLSSDQRIEGRCELCHADTRSSGTGLAFIEGKEALKAVANRLAGGALADHQVVLRSATPAASGTVSGRAMLRDAVRHLRATEWRAALAAIGPDTLTEVREPLAFSGQSLRWARVSEAKVLQGALARTRSRLTLFRGNLGTVHRGLQRLGELLAPGPGPGAEPASEAVAEARELLETMSRALKAAARARTILLRELGGVEEALFDPDALAKALRNVPRALQNSEWDAVRQALEVAHAVVGDADPGFDQAAVDLRAQAQAEQLARLLGEKLARLKDAFAAVLEDLPDTQQPAAAPVELVGASVIKGMPEGAVAPPGRRDSPRQLVAAAATSIRSLEVTLAVATNLGWSDFSLRESHLQLLATRFEALEKALQAGEDNAPEATQVRAGLETALGALATAEAVDGLQLVYRVATPASDSPFQADLAQLVGQAMNASLALEGDLGQRRVIKVNHKVHFQLRVDPSSGRVVDLGCLDCHRNIAHDKTQIETFRPPMVSCFVGGCHRKDRNKDNCQRCHFQHLGELADSTP